MARILKYNSVNVGNQNLMVQNQLSEELAEFIETTNNEYLSQLGQPPKEEEEVPKTDEEIRQELLDEAKLQAEEIINNASIEADSIKFQAEIEADNLKKQSQEEGFKQGQEEGLKQGNLECEDIKAKANKVLEDAIKERSDAIGNFEPEIIDFIMKAMQNIFTNEYKFNPEIIKFLINKGFSSIKKLEDIKVYVSPENYDLLKDEKILAGVDLAKNNIEILKDDMLTPNDCNIETQMGSINCGVTEQFDSLKQALYHMTL
ncbi:MAG: FliH/SctL family protein [bacterium]